MKRFFIPLVALVALVSCNQVGADAPEIRAVLTQYEKALNTSDAKLAQSLYTQDGIFMPNGAPTAEGAEAILKAYEQVFSKIQLDIDFSIDEIKVDHDVAFATSKTKGSVLIHATGETVPDENRELYVFEKVGGKWKIARYMFNKATPRH